MKHLDNVDIDEVADDLDPGLIVGGRTHKQDRHRTGATRCDVQPQGLADNGADLGRGDQVLQCAEADLDPHTKKCNTFIDQSAIHLCPHRAGGRGDVVGLYLNPPERALVLCVDEKTQIQALNRTAPVFPMLPGTPARASHDYVRHGTSSLYAALDLTTGKVIGALHGRHRAQEFLAFLKTIDANVPADLDVHLVLDNASTHKTPAVQRWLTAHPRFVVHFTPTSASWLNLVERWFAELTNKKLRRGTHTSVRQLNADIRAWIDTWNDNPRPYIWTKTADQILASIGNCRNRINDSRH